MIIIIILLFSNDNRPWRQNFPRILVRRDNERYYTSRATIAVIQHYHVQINKTNNIIYTFHQVPFYVLTFHVWNSIFFFLFPIEYYNIILHVRVHVRIMEVPHIDNVRRRKKTDRLPQMFRATILYRVTFCDGNNKLNVHAVFGFPLHDERVSCF